MKNESFPNNGRFTVSSGGHYAHDVVGSSTTGCVPHVTSPYCHAARIRWLSSMWQVWVGKWHHLAVKLCERGIWIWADTGSNGSGLSGLHRTRCENLSPKVLKTWSTSNLVDSTILSSLARTSVFTLPSPGLWLHPAELIRPNWNKRVFRKLSKMCME